MLAMVMALAAPLAPPGDVAAVITAPLAFWAALRAEADLKLRLGRPVRPIVISRQRRQHRRRRRSRS